MTFNEWRKINRPALRRTHPVGLVHNGSEKRVLGCICGAWRSYSGKWPVPKKVREWERKHNRDCMPAECRHD